MAKESKRARRTHELLSGEAPRSTGKNEARHAWQQKGKRAHRTHELLSGEASLSSRRDLSIGFDWLRLASIGLAGRSWRGSAVDAMGHLYCLAAHGADALCDGDARLAAAHVSARQEDVRAARVQADHTRLVLP